MILRNDVVGCAVIGAALACGCVDPEKSFNDFEDRLARKFDGGIIPEGGAGFVPDGGPCTMEPNQVEGTYLLTLSVSLAPNTPILARLEVTTPPFGVGAGFQFTGQPLSASDRSTPVGGELTEGPFPVDADGAFRAELSGLTIPGDANPISGAEIVADAVLLGSLCGDGESFCGIAQGSVTAPLALDLEGSTFTLTRVEDPQALPEPPPINCAGDLADPL